MLSDLRRLWRELMDELRGAVDEARDEFQRRKWAMDNPGVEPVGD